MTDEKKQEQETPIIKWVRPPEGVFETYSNQTHLAWSLDDVRVRFAQLGLRDDTLSPGSPFVSVNVEKAAITLSWRNAKILHHQLSQIISNYEKENGEINLKPKLASSDGT